MINAGMLRRPRQILEAVEAAAMADEMSVAREWHSRIRLTQLTSPCDTAVVSLYGYWVHVGASRTVASMNYERFASAIQRMPKGESRCWLFTGSLLRLQRQPPVPEAERIRAMIATLQDMRIPLPGPPTT